MKNIFLTLLSPIIRRHEDCIGFLLARFGRHQIELWCCPTGYEIPEHCHPCETIELFFLYGHDVLFSKRDLRLCDEQKVKVSFPRDIFKHFTIKGSEAHYFKVPKGRGKWLVFINWEKWIDGCRPSSASEDFVYTPKGKEELKCREEEDKVHHLI